MENKENEDFIVIDKRGCPICGDLTHQIDSHKSQKIEIPNYYGVIPANVRYDDRLPLLSRLMYAEISALCNKEGYCWASNSYFAKLYKKSPSTISRVINYLVNTGYILTQIDIKGGNKRKIYLTTPIPKTAIGIGKNSKTYPQKQQHNIISNKSNYNTIKKTVDNLPVYKQKHQIADRKIALKVRKNLEKTGILNSN